MKPKYSISYFIAIVLVLITMVSIYSFCTRQEVEGYVVIEDELYDESVNSNSDEVISTGYYLCELEGYVIVYLYDRTTVLYETDILMSLLPDYLQEEIYEGKYIENDEVLYSFLENYSS